ncbi:hypothetical protein QCD60_18360 [Pokkaliibacter sp. MBI-7]|uniref:hypothetical protein n=1 Tax=Pokkaliibacter sp. MBI-7 TaxID=3040600 RepID=UPI00244AFD0B|nr:hypothetical protein [Pokkaliibacter sp. MBI-7]MDH2434523.1 hypothetical protein [Pokkaliibacter sp. MBI-7]
MKWPWQKNFELSPFIQALVEDNTEHASKQWQRLPSPFELVTDDQSAAELIFVEGALQCAALLLHSHVPNVDQGNQLATSALCAKRHRVELVTLLLKHTFDLELTPDGQPWPLACLTMAPATDHMLLLNRLQQYGIDLNVRTKAGDTLLDLAIKSARPELVRHLIDSGMTADAIGKWVDRESLTSEQQSTLQLARRCLEDLRIRKLMLGR